MLCGMHIAHKGQTEMGGSIGWLAYSRLRAQTIYTSELVELQPSVTEYKACQT